MPLFDKKDTSIIGVDLGTASIKLIELSKAKDDSFTLVTYGFVEHFPRDIKATSQEENLRLGSAVQQIADRARCIAKSATAALPTYQVFTSLISLPRMSKEELDSAVHWEAKKIIPLPLEDITLDYKILNGGEQKKGSLAITGAKGKAHEVDGEEATDFKILVTGAGKDTVQRYSAIFEATPLTLVSLETEMFALARALVADDPGEIMIVEIGASITDIIIVESGVPFLSRSIEAGGNTLTRAIQAALQINERRAEQLKRDIGVTSFKDGQGGGDVPGIIKSALEPIIHEIRYTLDLYRNHGVTPSPHASGTIEKIILTGGSAMMPNLASYLSSALNLRVLVGDPWSRIGYPDDLKPILANIGPRFSVAIGLAMRENV